MDTQKFIEAVVDLSNADRALGDVYVRLPDGTLREIIDVALRDGEIHLDIEQ